MDPVEKATETQLKNIQMKTGKTLKDLTQLVSESGLKKHGEIRKFLIGELDLGYGDANLIAYYALHPEEQTNKQDSQPSLEDLLSEIYSGPKAAFRSLHDHLMSVIDGFGPFEIAPKKGYLSLRRKKQFIMIGPATNTRFELGLNVKGLEPDDRLKEQPKGSMCNYKIVVNEISEVNTQLINWLKTAYENAG